MTTPSSSVVMDTDYIRESHERDRHDGKIIGKTETCVYFR